jgi:hypothetical protein
MRVLREVRCPACKQSFFFEDNGDPFQACQCAYCEWMFYYVDGEPEADAELEMR